MIAVTNDTGMLSQSIIIGEWGQIVAVSHILYSTVPKLINPFLFAIIKFD